MYYQRLLFISRGVVQMAENRKRRINVDEENNDDEEQFRKPQRSIKVDEENINFDSLIVFDTFSLVCDYLGFHDVFSLELVCKKFAYFCTLLKSRRYFSQRVMSDLHRLNLGEAFFKSLKNDESIVSGSYIFKVLGKEDWENNDIDVYNIGFVSTPEEYSKNSQITKFLLEICQEDDYDEEGKCLVYETIGNNLFNMIRNYRIESSDIAIQLMTLNVKSVTTFVKTMYDLNFLKNTFDGERVCIWDKKAVRMRSSPYFFNSKSDQKNSSSPTFVENLNIEENYWQTVTRCQKYLKRGFLIEGFTRSIKQTNPVQDILPFNVIVYSIYGTCIQCKIRIQDIRNILSKYADAVCTPSVLSIEGTEEFGDSIGLCYIAAKCGGKSCNQIVQKILFGVVPPLMIPDYTEVWTYCSYLEQPQQQ